MEDIEATRALIAYAEREIKKYNQSISDMQVFLEKKKEELKIAELLALKQKTSAK